MISVIKSNSDLVEIADCHQVIIDAFASSDQAAVGKELRHHIERFLAEFLSEEESTVAHASRH